MTASRWFRSPRIDLEAAAMLPLPDLQRMLEQEHPEFASEGEWMEPGPPEPWDVPTRPATPEEIAAMQAFEARLLADWKARWEALEARRG